MSTAATDADDPVAKPCSPDAAELPPADNSGLHPPARGLRGPYRSLTRDDLKSLSPDALEAVLAELDAEASRQYDDWLALHAEESCRESGVRTAPCVSVLTLVQPCDSSAPACEVTDETEGWHSDEEDRSSGYDFARLLLETLRCDTAPDHVHGQQDLA